MEQGGKGHIVKEQEPKGARAMGARVKRTRQVDLTRNWPGPADCCSRCSRHTVHPALPRQREGQRQ